MRGWSHQKLLTFLIGDESRDNLILSTFELLLACRGSKATPFVLCVADERRVLPLLANHYVRQDDSMISTREPWDKTSLPKSAAPYVMTSWP